MQPNKPDIARYETFDDTPLITVNYDETVIASAQNYPYLYAKGGIVLNAPYINGKLVKMSCKLRKL